MKSRSSSVTQGAGLDSELRESVDRHRPFGGVPGGPATRVEPAMAGAGHAEGQQDILGALAFATAGAAARCRGREVAVHEFDDGGLVRHVLGLVARQVAVVLGDRARSSK